MIIKPQDVGINLRSPVRKKIPMAPGDAKKIHTFALLTESGIAYEQEKTRVFCDHKIIRCMGKIVRLVRMGVQAVAFATTRVTSSSC